MNNCHPHTSQKSVLHDTRSPEYLFVPYPLHTHPPSIIVDKVISRKHIPNHATGFDFTDLEDGFEQDSTIIPVQMDDNFVRPLASG